MEQFGGRPFEGISNTAVRKKKRSHTFRRPRPDSQPFSECRDFSSLSSTPPSDGTGKASSDEIDGIDKSSSRKEFDFDQSELLIPTPSGPDGERLHKKNRKEDVSLDILYSNSGSRDSNEQGCRGFNHRSSEGVLAPANWKSTNKLKDGWESNSRTMVVSNDKKSCDNQGSGSTGVNVDGLGNQNKVKRVKLKVGGATRTIDANPSSQSSRGSEPAIPRKKLTVKDISDDDLSPSDIMGSLQGIPWKDFPRGGFNIGKEDSPMVKMSGKLHLGKQGDKSDPVRKSRRVPKKRIIDGAFDDDDEDEEIRYLEKLKNSKLAAAFNDEEESSRKHRRLSKVSGKVGENPCGDTPPRLGKEGKKRSPSVDADYEELVESVVEPKRELTLTTRQRAMQSGRDAVATVIEFPNGLPPAPSRKQKEKLTDVEQQLKKAEAAQRRRMQNEKAARESEAEAIRKILGQDSNRKKREERNKKRQEELAQEKAADALVRASSTVKWILGPNGTTVTFPKDGLPSIFDPKPSSFSYPPPREKCAGPSCTNPYKYRDSKTKLPLCSLQCYKAIHVTVQRGTGAHMVSPAG